MSKYLQTTHRDIAWIKQADGLGQIEMTPPFQRNPVWTLKQKSFLIDSILSGYPVPEIYMQDIVNEKGEQKYIVVDGQQRITACLDYIYGNFAIDSQDSPKYADLSFDDLSSDQKKALFSYKFVIRLLPEISDIELREIFQRLNRNNVALNPQELRQATYWGPFISYMNELAAKDSWAKFGLFSTNDIKRMLDVEFISELSVAVLHGLQNKKTTLDKYYQLYEEDFQTKSELSEIIDVVLGELSQIIPEMGKSRFSKKTDFYTLFLILCDVSDQLPLPSEKRDEIRQTLKEFSDQVDIFLKVEKEAGDLSSVSENVKIYSLNIRASSDLGARKKRDESLRRELQNILEFFS